LGAPNPHIFSVGAAAYKQLRETGRNQSIVVTGISGAGKTEANKYLLQYLCWRSTQGAADELPMSKVVLSSTPVFEAFGNATTVSMPQPPRLRTPSAQAAAFWRARQAIAQARCSLTRLTWAYYWRRS
jgi:myosin-5